MHNLIIYSLQFGQVNSVVLDIVVDSECLAYGKDKIKVYVVQLNKLELGYWHLAPCLAVPGDGLMWEDVKHSGGESPHAQRHGLC